MSTHGLTPKKCGAAKVERDTKYLIQRFALWGGISVASGSVAILALAMGFGLILPLALIVLLVTVIAMKFPGFAWFCYFLSISLTGVVVELGPALVHAELLAIPLLMICVVRIKSTEFIQSRSRHLALPVMTLAVGYFAWAVVTTLVNAPTPLPSLWILFQILTGFLAFAVLGVSDGEKLRLVKSGSLILGGIAALSILSWFARSLGVPVALTPGVAMDGRLIGFSFETNIFASQCVAWLALCSRRWSDLGRSTKVANVVLGVAVILAGTRAAWIALAFVLVLSGLESARRSYKWLWGAVSIIAAAMILIPNVLEAGDKNRDTLSWRLGNLFSTDVGTGAYRTGIYETALADIDSVGRAMVGSGINSFSQFHLVDPTGVSASYLSSIWIATLYDTGIIGCLLFFSLLISIIASCRSRFDGIVVVGALLICASATNLIWFHYPWVCLALLSLGTTKIRLVSGTRAAADSFKRRNNAMYRVEVWK
ncbi:hypothetical protein SRABI128_05679 [Microbacterium sp. Bi128]|nr:hypothetical protein SRABI128_05679 [Microbacterium sp. Bi128]